MQARASQPQAIHPRPPTCAQSWKTHPSRNSAAVGTFQQLHASQFRCCSPVCTFVPLQLSHSHCTCCASSRSANLTFPARAAGASPPPSVAALIGRQEPIAAAVELAYRHAHHRQPQPLSAEPCCQISHPRFKGSFEFQEVSNSMKCRHVGRTEMAKTPSGTSLQPEGKNAGCLEAHGEH